MNTLLIVLILILGLSYLIGFVFLYLSLRILASKINRNRCDMDVMLEKLNQCFEYCKHYKELYQNQLNE